MKLNIGRDGPHIFHCRKIGLVGEAINAADATLLYLPSYSPDFDPIENAFAKLEAMMRAKAERSICALWNAVGFLICQSVRLAGSLFAPAGGTVAAGADRAKPLTLSTNPARRARTADARHAAR